MTMRSLSLLLLPDGVLSGDLSLERWPTYLDDLPYVRTIQEIIRTCDFIVTPSTLPNTDRVERFLVGDNNRSRPMTVHLDDPRGIVYVLEDAGDAWMTAPLRAVRALTVCELVRDSYHGVVRHLELDRHHNYRLAPQVPQNAVN